MTRSARHIQIAITVARRRSSLTALAILLGAALSMSVSAFAAVHNSSTAAIRQSVQGDFGQRAYALQSADRAVAKIVEARGDASPVVDSDGVLTANDLATDVLVRSTTDPALKLGVLTSGRRPSKPGDVLVSEVIATSLGIQKDDVVGVSSDGGDRVDTTVTGFVVDTSDSSARIVVRLVADSARFAPTRWLLDVNPVDDPDIGPVLAQTSAQVASAKRAVPLALENQPGVVSTLRFLPAGAGLLLGCLLLGIIARLGAHWRPAASTLQAAGMSHRSAWFVFVAWISASVLLGEALGIASALAMLDTVKGPVSSWFGQAWVRVEIPTWEITILLLTTMIFALAALPGLRWVVARARRSHAQRRTRSSRKWVFALWVAAGSYWAYLVFLDQRGADESLPTAVVVGAVAVGFTPYALGLVLETGLPPAVCSMYRALVGEIRLVAALAAGVAFLSGVWSAQTFDVAGRGQASDSPLQPPASLVLSEAPDGNVPMIVDLYGKYGGEEVRTFLVPREGKRVVRVTSPDLAQCVIKLHPKSPDELPPGCWPDPKRTATPINFIALESSSAVRADPGLVHAGKVGLLTLQSTGSAPPLVGAAFAQADADDNLGGVVAGLVVPAGGAVAAEYGLTPSGVSQMLFLDYDTLSPAERLRLRAEIARIAPTALINDGTGPSAYDSMRSAAAAVGLFGAVAISILLLLGGYASVQTAGVARRALQDLGAVPSVRWSLVARWLTIPAASSLLAGALAYATASWGGRADDFMDGSFWAAPVGATLLVVLVLGVWLARPTTNEWDTSDT